MKISWLTLFFYIYQTLTCFQGTSGNFKLINEKNENLFLTAPLSISLAAYTTLVTQENLRVGQWTHPPPAHCKPACFPYFTQFAVKWRREAWYRAVLQFGRHIIRRRKRNQLLSTFQCDVRLSLCGKIPRKCEEAAEPPQGRCTFFILRRHLCRFENTPNYTYALDKLVNVTI